MPENVVVAEGKTTNEAIENGLKMLKASKDMVDIKVLENEDKRSFFSILAPRIVKVELTLKEDKNNKEQSKEVVKVKKEKEPVSKENVDKAKDNAKIFLDNFFEKVGKDIIYTIDIDLYGLNIVMSGESAGDFIGYRGETLYALQTLISSVANKNIDEKIRVLLDIENYKDKREKALQNLAARLEKTVERTGKKVTLEPMQAYERKIIHSCLQNSKKVKTESIGEEPRRRIVISLK